MAPFTSATRKRWARNAAVAGVILIALAAVAVWIAGGMLAAPVLREVGPPPEDLVGRTAIFTSGPAPSMAGWWFRGDEPRATVLLLHPLRGDRRVMVGRARLLVEAGYDAVVIDLQAHGERPGEAITFGAEEKNDVIEATQLIRATAPGRPMAIVGWSLGGAAAVLAGPLDVDAMVLESVYPSIDRAIANRLSLRTGFLGAAAAPLFTSQLPLRLGVSAADLRPIDKIAEIGCPVLVLSGEADPRTTAEETRELFAAAVVPKQMKLFPNAEHVDLLESDPAAWRAAVLSFLERYTVEKGRSSGEGEP
jgi:alpha-beta hydrolase superfamily lysophospholipase